MRIGLMFASVLFCHSAIAANYGADMPLGEARDIATAITENPSAQDITGKFSGRITQVCQKEGCWLMIESDGQAARVEMKDHAFVVPKQSHGSATAYGVLSQVELSPKAAKHLAEDSGEKSKALANNEWRILASAIEIND